MCGISLIYHADGRSPEADTIARMTRALRHRGGDDQGTLIRGRAALGHNRLSIVGIEGGAQPMVTADGRYVIVFNGEIYNYRELRAALRGRGVEFRTETDTEVVLQLYREQGGRCVDRLRGMFSFAVHDAERDRVFVARDRLGIKPLFYHWRKATLLVASEIKALFASRRVAPSLQPESIRNYFTYQFSIPPNTPFEGIYELPPGHSLFIGPGGAPTIRRYWDLEFPVDGHYESLDEGFWRKRFAQGLADAVSSHTTGDVPIGAYLSGGIDSSAVAWLLSEHYPDRLQTYSIRFADPEYDESAISRRTAEYLTVGNEELLMGVRSPEAYLGDLERCIYHLEQPQRMAVDIPHLLLSGLVRSSGYKVVHTGDGADEILGGYDCYRQDYMRYWGNQVRNNRLRRRHYLTEYTRYFSEAQVRLLMRLHRQKNQRKVLRQFGCYPAWYDFWHITEDLLPGLFLEEYGAEAAGSGQLDALVEEIRPRIEGRHMLNQSLYIETRTRLPGWILWKSDRLSMANSVEARVPYLDHPLVELAARMPPGLKLNGMDEKYILKRISETHLPESPTAYKKRAFYTPIREWFFPSGDSAALEPYLSREALAGSGIFNVGRVHELRCRLAQEAPPASLDDYYRIMKSEWVLFLVLTVQILYRQFVGGHAACLEN